MTTQKTIGRFAILAAIVSIGAFIAFFGFASQFEHLKEDYVVFVAQQRDHVYKEMNAERIARDKHIFQALHRKDFTSRLAFTSGGLAAFLALCFLVLKKGQPNKSVQTTAMTPPPSATPPAPLSDL